MTDELDLITAESERLHAEMESLRSVQSPELLSGELLKRKSFKIRIKKLDAGFAKEIHRIQALRKILDHTKDETELDISELTSLYFQKRDERKDTQYFPQA